MEHITGIVTYILSAAGMLAFAAATILYESATLLGGLALVALVIVFLYERTKHRNLTTEGKTDAMVSKRRAAQLKSRYADKIHDFLFEMFVAGDISRIEYKEALRTFGQACDLPDLRTQSRKKTDIRHRVRYNLQSMRNAMKNVRSGTIPGPKPGEYVAPPQVVEQEVFGGKFLARHAQKEKARS